MYEKKIVELTRIVEIEKEVKNSGGCTMSKRKREISENNLQELFSKIDEYLEKGNKPNIAIFLKNC
ncbi:hypothetical protein FHQ18_11475 [Deferribacter autotrophicus]|uniref:Uncharacterized protein n=1 Tax=Deferribacter autotrophicus TaxID=500465 RepID=A0A5A8F1N9_9BACT|nr:hypothetical protein [Deferribacter autotrophicus]KAA0257179.1 hypothetical protein FHQ18_11475 [Deferribacter autotrophicus]